MDAGLQSAPASFGPVAVAAPSKPPTVHWLVVLLLWPPTLGIFVLVTLIRQGLWARRVNPESKALATMLGGVGLFAASQVISVSAADAGVAGVGLIMSLGAGVCLIWAYFQVRDTIEDCYDVKLSGLMTFFFNVLYFQYHLRRIARGDFITNESASLR